MLTVENYTDLGNGVLSDTEAEAVIRYASTSITDRIAAMDLGWLACRGLGYDAASSLNPFDKSELAMAYDAGVGQHEIEADLDADDFDDYSDITDRPLSITDDEHNTATVAFPDPVRMTAVHILSVTSLVLFGVAAFIHFA